MNAVVAESEDPLDRLYEQHISDDDIYVSPRIKRVTGFLMEEPDRTNLAL